MIVENNISELLLLLAALLGLLWGSFLNVVIYRLPRKESIVTGRSYCPSCRNTISFYDNIPVVSYILLRGRCRHCGAQIGFRYPMVEIVMGIMSWFLFSVYGLSLEYFVQFVFIASMLVLMFVDFYHQLLPDGMTLTGIACGILLSVFRENLVFNDAIIGTLLGAGGLFVVAEIYFRWSKVEGMGFGDVKMLGMIGSFVGWKGVLLTLFLGSLMGSAIGVFLIVLRGGHLKTKLPFGTFLGFGAIVTSVFGTSLIDWYSRLL